MIIKDNFEFGAESLVFDFTLCLARKNLLIVWIPCHLAMFDWWSRLRADMELGTKTLNAVRNSPLFNLLKLIHIGLVPLPNN